MTVAMTMVVDAAPELIAASLAFHLNTGVDYVVAGDPGADPETTEILDSFSADVVRRLAVEAPTGPSRSELTRLALGLGAEWVIPSRADEFWWPRGENLRNALAVIPPRYGVVHGLLREFITEEGSGDLVERTITRTSLLDVDVPGDDFRRLLRPVYRARPELVIDDSNWTLGGYRVPLRAWYPIEVFRFPGPHADGLDPHGTLVEDTRLREALRRIRDGEGGESGLALPVPTLVDDASYAVECAAVGEVDLVRLDGQIRELELRIAELEARFWPMVRRKLRQLARRPS